MSMRLKFYMASILCLSLCCACNNNKPAVESNTPKQTARQVADSTRTTVPPTRLFLVVLDSSKSYKDHTAALQGLVNAIANLGPGDQLILARITERLDPKDFVIIDGQWSTNKPDEEVFKPTKNIAEWQKRQRILEAAWQEAENSSQKLVSILEREKTQNTAPLTDLYGALEYGALWLKEQPSAEKTLIVLSDLENDKGRPTFDPPLKSLDLRNIHIKLLFVTYRNADHWTRLESAWRKFFSNAASLTMLDSGRSPMAMISPSKTPRTLQHPFQIH